MWLLTMVIFFSFAGKFQAYYTVMLAPAIAALVGAGGVAL
jgi:4-amino-4-deoxy-L-arabinose transferase-like glycosyltransferase